MTKTTISRILTGIAAAAFAFALVLSVPSAAHANSYYGYPGYYGNAYPPAPNLYTIPSVQVVYANGYYQNYYVPTVRYFPAVNPVPVPTT